MSPPRALPLLVTALVLTGGCSSSTVVKPTGDDEVTVDCLDSGRDGFGFRCESVGYPLTRSVDVLFVVDNGPDGGAWQSRLADALPGLG